MSVSGKNGKGSAADAPQCARTPCLNSRARELSFSPHHGSLSGKCGFYVCRKKNQSHLSRIKKLDLKVPLDVKSDLLKKGSSR